MKFKTVLILALGVLLIGGFVGENILVWNAGIERGYQQGLKAGIAPEIDKNAFYAVTRVKDGDTISVRVGEKDIDVRMLGINTPETERNTHTGAQCHGSEASQRGREVLEGKKVRLEFDASQGAFDSRGKRHLAYVWLEDGTLYQAHMLKSGSARQYKLSKKYEKYDQFCALEKEAQASRKGLWATDACAAESDPPKKNRKRHVCQQ